MLDGSNFVGVEMRNEGSQGGGADKQVLHAILTGGAIVVICVVALYWMPDWLRSS